MTDILLSTSLCYSHSFIHFLTLTTAIIHSLHEIISIFFSIFFTDIHNSIFDLISRPKFSLIPRILFLIFDALLLFLEVLKGEIMQIYNRKQFWLSTQISLFFFRLYLTFIYSSRYSFFTTCTLSILCFTNLFHVCFAFSLSSSRSKQKTFIKRSSESCTYKSPWLSDSFHWCFPLHFYLLGKGSLCTLSHLLEVLHRHRPETLSPLSNK